MSPMPEGGVLRTHTTGSGHHFVRHELVHFSHTAVPAYADVQEFAALEDFRRTYGDRLGLGYAFSQTDSTKLYREFVAEIGGGPDRGQNIRRHCHGMVPPPRRAGAIGGTDDDHSRTADR